MTTPPQKHFHPLTSSTGDKGTARSWRLRRGFEGGVGVFAVVAGEGWGLPSGWSGAAEGTNM